MFSQDPDIAYSCSSICIFKLNMLSNVLTHTGQLQEMHIRLHCDMTRYTATCCKKQLMIFQCGEPSLTECAYALVVPDAEDCRLRPSMANCNLPHT